MSDNKLAKLASSCGLIYPGTRIKSVPPPQLAEDLAEEFLTDRDAQKKILKELRKANEKIISRIHNSTVKEIENIISDPKKWVADGRFGTLIFAMAMDERPEVQNRANELIEMIEDVITDVAETGEEEEDWLEENEVEDGYLDYLQEHTTQLKKEKEQLVRKNTQNKKEIDSLKERLKGRENQLAALRRELTEKNSLLTKKEREYKELKNEINSLEEKLKKAEAKAKESPLSGAIHQLERENKRLTHFVDKIYGKGGEAANGNSDSRYIESMVHQLDRMRQGFLDNQSTQTERISEIAKSMDEISKKVDFIYAQTRSEKAKETKMKKKEGPLRVGVFVDVQNLYYAARHFSARIDFQQLLSVSVGDRRLVRAIAYVVQSPEIDQSAFVSMLEQKNYAVRRKDLKVRADGSTKGDWDMGMAVDIMELCDKLDVVVIASGDGDFVSLVHLIKTKGPRVEILSFLHNTARELIEAADSHFPISESMFLK